jgi:dihydroorotate dehydrogenase electron transfer subunit
VSKNGAGIEVLYRRIGRGTEMLSRKTNGETLDVLGPLGRGFDLGGTFRTALIVAGGLGIAPVLLLIDRLIKRGKRVLLLWGVRKAAEITVLETLPKRGVRIHLATEDGSEGFRGRVTDLLGKFLPESGSLASPRGFACGPMPMLRTLQPVALNTGFGWQASLEERMACGVGVCQGCMVRLRGLGYKTVCADGPVFNLMELDIDG